jgi:hypothetical protein
MIKTRSYIANDKYKRWKRRYARNCAALRKINRYISRHRFSPPRRACDGKDTGGGWEIGCKIVVGTTKRVEMHSHLVSRACLHRVKVILTWYTSNA